MKTIFLVVGVVMILEGIPYFTMPEQVKSIAEKIMVTDNRVLRVMGFSLMMGGLVMVALFRS